MLKIKKLLILTMVFVAANSNANELIATDALEALAADAKFTRQVSGGLTIAAGLGFTAIGIAASQSCNENNGDCMDDYSGLVIGTGLVMAGLGGLQLIIPTDSERSLAAVNNIDDDMRRESRAYAELDGLASKAKTGRLLSGGLSAGLGFFYLVAPAPYEELETLYLYNGILLASMGVAQLIIPTKVERVFSRVEKQKSYISQLDYAFGLSFSQLGEPSLRVNLSF